MRFSGQFTLSVDCARQGTSYKYVVVKKDYKVEDGISWTRWKNGEQKLIRLYNN